MENIRIISRLDIKGPNLVKGIHLEGLRVLGKPWDFAYKYYQEGIDELIYIDSVASLYGRNNLLEIVKKTAEDIFIPLTVGGGVRSIQDIKNLLRAGADKVAINTAAIHNPDLITQASKVFGAQCIVASIQAKLIDGTYYACSDNAREIAEVKVFDWVKKLVDLGAGEILVTSVDNEGTGLGFDTQLINNIAESVPIPVIACGGCGRLEHILEVIAKGKADAVCISSMFHYKYLEGVMNSDGYHEEGNIEFIKSTRGGLDFMKSRLILTDIPAVKEYLNLKSISVRK